MAVKIAARMNRMAPSGIRKVNEKALAMERAGEKVLISGAGPIGLIIGIMCRFSGAAHVVLSEIHPTRIQIARDMGFEVCDPNSDGFDAACAANTDGEGFDKIFEITSVQSSFATCVRQLKRGGTVVQVGMPPAKQTFDLDINKIIYSECNLCGVRHHTMNDMQTAVKIINSGVLNDQLAKLVSVVYPMDQSMEALERARSDKSVLRVLIDCA